MLRIRQAFAPLVCVAPLAVPINVFKKAGIGVRALDEGVRAFRLVYAPVFQAVRH
jgi:hypothetical protein